MNTDEKWQQLLVRSSSTFAGEAMPPYGFITGTMAQLRETRQQQVAERIGWRALMASLATLGVAAVVAVTVNFTQQSNNDLEPGVRGFVQLENIPLS
jgi:hypothetical protein